METESGHSEVSVQEAAASLASAKDSSRRVRRAGYPVWFWLATGLAFAAFPFYVGPPSSVDPWIPEAVGSLVGLLSLLVVLGAAYALERERPIRERTNTFRSGLQVVAFLWRAVPPIAVLLVGGITWGDGLWQAPWAPLVTGAAAYVVWVGVGLATTSRPVRR